MEYVHLGLRSEDVFLMWSLVFVIRNLQRAAIRFIWWGIWKGDGRLAELEDLPLTNCLLYQANVRGTIPPLHYSSGER